MKQIDRKISLSDDYLLELKEWVNNMINEAEKNDDTPKRNQFIALRSELL